MQKNDYWLRTALQQVYDAFVVACVSLRCYCHIMIIDFPGKRSVYVKQHGKCGE